jgi:hypothetical protein
MRLLLCKPIRVNRAGTNTTTRAPLRDQHGRGRNVVHSLAPSSAATTSVGGEPYPNVVAVGDYKASCNYALSEELDALIPVADWAWPS